MKRFIMTSVLSGLASLAGAQAHFNSGSTGADGDLILADAETRVLNMDAHADGVFNYVNVTLGQNATLTVERNADNTPLVILVQNNFTLGFGSRIVLEGTAGIAAAGAAAGQGGPGGFQGGLPGEASPSAKDPGPGLGPGGGTPVLPASQNGVDGGGQNTHMRPSLIPLIGGSGGGGGFAADSGAGGGGGGGALLIAVSGVFTSGGSTIDCSGGDGGYQFFGANGGGGGGSGGAVRIIAGEIFGNGRIDVRGGAFGEGQGGIDAAPGQDGIIRLETFRMTRNFDELLGRVFTSLPGLVNTDATDLSTLRISSIGGVSVPTNAGANVAQPDVVIPAGVTNPVTIQVAATNVTPGTPVTLRINMNANAGQIIEQATGPLAGTNASSTASASVNLPAGVGTIAAIIKNAVPGGGAEPPKSTAEGSEAPAERALSATRVTIDGEPVESVELVSTLGAAGREFVYVTKSGKRASYLAP